MLSDGGAGDGGLTALVLGQGGRGAEQCEVAGASEKKGGLLLGLEGKDDDWGLRSTRDTKKSLVWW